MKYTCDHIKYNTLGPRVTNLFKRICNKRNFCNNLAEHRAFDKLERK